MENKFLELLGLDVNDKVEQKNGMNYLSWSFAWSEFCKVYPNATYKVLKDQNMNCAFGNEKQGYMVYTEVNNGFGLIHEMWLPVMDFKNKSMLNPSTFDINKAVMRCLVKNLAVFGLGLYIYSGSDLPENVETESQKQARLEKEEKEKLALLEKQKADELALHGKLVHDLNALMGDNTDMFEKSIIKMNKTFKTDYKGFGEFNNVQLQQYINYLNKQKESK